MKVGIQTRIYKLNTGQYQLSYWHPIEQKRVRNKFSTKKEAKIYCLELENHYSAKNLTSFSNQPVGRLIDIHLFNCPNTKFTARKNTYNAFRKRFDHFPIVNLTKKELQAWLQEIKQQNNYTDKNLIRIKSNINFLMKWLLEEQYIHHNPLQGVQFKRNLPPKRARVILSTDEIKLALERVKTYSPDVLYPVIYTLIHTGARRSEVMTLKWENVDFATGFINFRHTKNGESRRVRMSKPLEEFLKNHPKQNHCVFTNQYGEPLGRGKLQRLMKGFKRRFPSQKQWNCHDLRHSFAYNFLKKGGEMYQLKAILGHKTIQMTVDLYGNLKAVDIENPSPFEF